MKIVLHDVINRKELHILIKAYELFYKMFFLNTEGGKCKITSVLCFDENSAD